MDVCLTVVACVVSKLSNKLSAKGATKPLNIMEITKIYILKNNSDICLMSYESYSQTYVHYYYICHDIFLHVFTFSWT